MISTNNTRLEQQLRQMSGRGLSVAVVVPCYNVEGHLPVLVPTIPDYVKEIILVDDGSLDNTGKLIDQLSDKRITTIHLPENRGVGGAVLAGFEKAAAL